MKNWQFCHVMMMLWLIVSFVAITVVSTYLAFAVAALYGLLGCITYFREEE